MTDPIQVEVAADGRGVLVAGDDRWTFDLDLDSGTAVLAAGGTGGEPVRVRPLRWREKLALARFAGLDDVFLARAVAATCATARPTVGPDDATVTALAVWLEGPAAAAALGGSDPGQLAAITVDLCRLTGLRPSDLDDLPAGEVAQLWLAALGAAGDAGLETGARPEQALDAWSAAATRIVVIDDPAVQRSGQPADGGVDETAVDREASTTAGGDTSTEAAPAATRRDADLATPEADVGPDDSATARGRAQPARPAAERAPAVALRRATTDPPTLVGAPRGQGSEDAPPTAPTNEARPDRDANASPPRRHVVSHGVPEPAVPRAATSRGTLLESADRQGRHAAPGLGLGESSAVVPAPVEAARGEPPTATAVASRPTTPPPILGRTRETARAIAATDPRLPARQPFPAAASPAVAPSPTTGPSVALKVRDPAAPWATAVPDPGRPDLPRSQQLDRSERDALFQSLADELELAAAELGIGSEA